MNDYSKNTESTNQTEKFDSNLFFAVLNTSRSVNEKKLQPIVVK